MNRLAETHFPKFLTFDGNRFPPVKPFPNQQVKTLSKVGGGNSFQKNSAKIYSKIVILTETGFRQFHPYFIWLKPDWRKLAETYYLPLTGLPDRRGGGNPSKEKGFPPPPSAYFRPNEN